MNPVENIQFAALTVQYETDKMNTRVWIFKRSIDPNDTKSYTPIEIDLDKDLDRLFPKSKHR